MKMNSFLCFLASTLLNWFMQSTMISWWKLCFSGPNWDYSEQSFPKYPGFERDVFKAIVQFFEEETCPLVPKHILQVFKKTVGKQFNFNKMCLSVLILWKLHMQQLITLIPTEGNHYWWSNNNYLLIQPNCEEGKPFIAFTRRPLLQGEAWVKVNLL